MTIGAGRAVGGEGGNRAAGATTGASTREGGGSAALESEGMRSTIISSDGVAMSPR